jgi:hypothetical protein
MNWEKLSSPDLRIRELQSTIQDSGILLTWFWPREIDFVYIYKAHADNLREIGELERQDLKLYTREEYKVNQGYTGRLDMLGRHAYRILPGQKRNGNLVVFMQETEENLIYVSGGRAKIYFSISYKNKLLLPRKKVKVSITTELPFDKELLCFVKKREAVPLSLDDGTWFPFVRDFPAGKTELPEIEIEKNEFIRIFFSKGKQSTDIYELIPE